jgi:hypothetical protein
MANIRKTFNFRNGVQVDEDNLIVNSLGLVGIGTSVPTETLDVRGTAKIVGLATVTELGATTATIGVATIRNLTAGGNISINSGVITAISGVVTYYGDGAGLINIPTSQWVDVDSGLGYTSIYAAGFVGVTTNFPYFPFQVGGTGTLATFNNGVGIGSEGNILATGIVTAGSFIGNGSNLTNLNANNIASGTINTNRLPVLPNDKLPSNISVSGIITAGSGFVGNVTGNLTGTADTALNVVSSARLSIDDITTNTSAVGIATVNTRLYSAGSIGIQTNNPQSDLHITKTGISSIQLTGTTESIITLGRSIAQTQNTGGIRFGNTNGLFPYSNGSSFDVINYDAGNLNYYLHYGNPTGINTGAFRWIYGKDPTNPLMSLTYDGKLGIGVTNPSNTLEVNGIGTFTSSLFVGSSLDVAGTLTAGSLSITSINADMTGDLTGNVNATSGISTFNNITVSTATTTGVLRVNAPTNVDSIYTIQANSGGNAFVVSASGVGIKTSILRYPEVDLDCTNASISTKAVGVGTTSFTSAVDFSAAGKGITVVVSGTPYPDAGCFMVVPKVTSAGRALIVAPTDGAIIYNTSTSKFEGYVGSSWVDLGASSGIGAVVDDTSPQLGGNLTLNGKNITGTGNINVTGSGSITNLNVSGISTFAGITTVTGNTLFAKQINSVGVVTASSFIRQGGTSSQFLKADGSVDSNTYLTSYTETSTLDNVTSRGNTTTNGISVGVATVTELKVGTGITANSGIVTAINGFHSGIGTAVQITTVGDQLIFTVPGVGSTSFTLY